MELLIDGCELPQALWELNLGPLEEHPSFLNHRATSLAQLDIYVGAQIFFI